MSEGSGSGVESGPRGPEAAVDLPWPVWARVIVTFAVVWHIGAVLAGGLGTVPPMSSLEETVRQFFRPYYDLVDQGYAYHFYAPDPPTATPIILATMHFSDCRPDQILRIPERGVRPPLVHHRQVHLAESLFNDFEDALSYSGNGRNSRLARSYARHLCKTQPGCTSVTLELRIRRVPAMDAVAARLDSEHVSRVDIDSEENYDSPRRIGDYTSDEF
jgi:hypothetical protein